MIAQLVMEAVKVLVNPNAAFYRTHLILRGQLFAVWEKLAVIAQVACYRTASFNWVSLELIGCWIKLHGDKGIYV